jgi:hypothetical protein
MAIQKSTDLRDAQNDAIETILGASPILEIRSGAQPANCAAADSGTLVASMALPADAFAASSAGAKAKLGTWEDPAADNANGGGAMHFRLKTSGGVCKLQGSVTVTGGGGDLTLDNMTIAAGQKITITSFTITASGA